MTLAKLFEFIAKVYQTTTNILGISQQVLTVLGLPAQEDTATTILVVTTEDHDLLTDPTVGLLALADKLDDVLTDLTTGITAIEAAIALVQQTGDPVTLPTTPPTGYGGSDAGATAAAVWGDTAAYALPSKGWFMNLAGAVAGVHMLGFNIVHAEAPLFTVTWDASTGIFPTPTEFPQPLLSNAVSGDTVTTFLTREAPDFDWLEWPFDRDYIYALDPVLPLIAWEFRWSNQEFAVLLGSLFPLGSSLVPPIWPGISNVTLGTPVDISSQFTITQPMDGVIVTITAVTISKIALAYDTATAYKNIGGLSFFNDNGDQEAFQLLQFDDEAYVPFTMQQAAGVRFRVDPAVVGTVTPWVVV